ncbi:anhydro-N-acetylmuramic acid kinase [Catellatospora tritici]|uniref:anhydro-N-acetylmuramic acid kinase n=1 Tax=Catellatospora tritici TaxID=2851566 RepID=UPI001C2D7795|nr:anhydro-N-acetylmuramic acid kinase [Catellatospora tritici]MBV1850728.1 anhydro-N-acetylmuramic acid kinase [Catellatospora tritici]MBV1850981.1 anhydro-N-acetylmuramic acid kinase [Catellatospora tritici]
MKIMGMMSGTSHDGIDVAVVDFRLAGDELHGRLEYADTTPYPHRLREQLAATLPPASLTFAEVCALDTGIGQAFAAAAAQAVDRVGSVDLVCSHGQTVYHWVDDGQVLGTLQLGQPAWIAERLGVPVVADLRIRDITAGGQGAPLVSLMDALLLSGLPGRPAALNLGGIANLTVPRPTGGSGPLAFDTGPANALIDAAALRVTGGRHAHDTDGRLAAAGTVHRELLAHLLAEPYYGRDAPKTTGKELFHAGYLDAALAAFPPVADVDLMATLTALTAATVADQVRRYEVDTLVASGGGCANPTLMAMLAARLPGVEIAASDAFGAPSAAKEAIAFALLGWYTAHGLPGTVPSATGAGGGRVLGTLVPGDGPLLLPAPLPAAPLALRLG